MCTKEETTLLLYESMMKYEELRTKYAKTRVT